MQRRGRHSPWRIRSIKVGYIYPIRRCNSQKTSSIPFQPTNSGNNYLHSFPSLKIGVENSSLFNIRKFCPLHVMRRNINKIICFNITQGRAFQRWSSAQRSNVSAKRWHTVVNLATIYSHHVPLFQNYCSDSSWCQNNRKKMKRQHYRYYYSSSPNQQ